MTKETRIQEARRIFIPYGNTDNTEGRLLSPKEEILLQAGQQPSPWEVPLQEMVLLGLELKTMVLVVPPSQEFLLKQLL